MPNRLESDPLPRRDFLGWAGLLTAGAAIFGSLLGMVRLTKPRVLPEISARFRVGKRADFAAGVSKIIPEQGVRVVANEDGVRAMSMICTHLGCIVDEKPDGFACPCHGSKFDSEGRVVSGPAPRGLAWLSVSQAADGNLIVDKDREVSSKEAYPN